LPRAKILRHHQRFASNTVQWPLYAFAISK
jgi:hypothetical protein